MLKNVKSTRIVVIGAGSAGIAAATRLIEAGYENVLILEAENRIGGRVNTVPFADNVVDLGAQWCHGEKNNVVYELVKDLDMLDRSGTFYEDIVSIRSNSELVPKEINVPLKNITYHTLQKLPPEQLDCECSLGALYTDKYWEKIDKLPKIDRTIAHEFFAYFKKDDLSQLCADTMFEISARGNLQIENCEGDMMLIWKDKGYKSFLRLLMKSISDNADDLGVLNKRVLFNRRIEQINWNDKLDQIEIKCWKGQIITTDHVICTMSLGVLKECHKHMFKPPLPIMKCCAIEGLKFGNINKFFLEFEEPIGPEEWSVFVFLWMEKDLVELRKSDNFWLESVYAFYRVTYQPRLLQGWIIGPHARYMESLTEEKVLEGLLWLLRKFLTFPVPEPLNFLRTQWHSNPNFRGTYSYRSLHTEEMRTDASDLAAPVNDENGKPILQFAGEATSTHHFATVHGAVESGWREAQRLIDYHEKQAVDSLAETTV